MRVIMPEALNDYFKINLPKEKTKGKVIIIGNMGGANKMFTVSFGKNGLSIPAIFSKLLFKDADIKPAHEGIFFPLLICDEKYLNPEVIKILKDKKTVVVT